VNSITQVYPLLSIYFYLLHYLNIVAYLLKARTVEAERQPLLGNDPYTRSRGKLHVRCDVTQQ
jgi:hypothetical protein